MATRLEPTTPVYENTTMQKVYFNDVHKLYYIYPDSGYVLHVKTRDWPEEDPETGEEIIKQGFTSGMASCPANYDFTANPLEFFAVPEDSVPADQIFGGGNNHEIA